MCETSAVGALDSRSDLAAKADGDAEQPAIASTAASSSLVVQSQSDGLSESSSMPSVSVSRPAFEAAEHEVSAAELSKWNEMMDMGIPQYMQAHPNSFHRRVRRGIPQRFRWQVWKAKVGVDEAGLSIDYHALSQRSNAWTAQIEIDIGRTFPELRSFSAEQQQKLFRVLNAYAGYNPDVGYCQGMNYVAGLLLIVSDMQEEESFAVLARLMDDPDFGLSGFYRERLPLLRRYLRACESLVADTVPELRDHFIRENVQPAVYLHQWFLTLFINCFPLSMVMIIWDVIICEGLPVILRIAVSILQVLKDSLLSMHFEEIIKFFKMMKTYDDEDGELNAFRIGQLLMKHTEHVQIPDRTLEYLGRELAEDDGSLDSDESWEADLNGGGWWQSFSRMFSFGSNKRRATTTAVAAGAIANTPGGGTPGGGTPGGGTSSSSTGGAATAAAAAAASAHSRERNSSINSAPAALATAPATDARQPGEAGATSTSTAEIAPSGPAISAHSVDSRLPPPSSAASAAAGGSAGGGRGGPLGAARSAVEPLEDETLTRGWEFL